MRIDAVVPKPIEPPPTHFTLTLSKRELHDLVVMVSVYEMGDVRSRRSEIDDHTDDYHHVKAALIRFWKSQFSTDKQEGK